MARPAGLRLASLGELLPGTSRKFTLTCASAAQMLRALPVFTADSGIWVGCPA